MDEKRFEQERKRWKKFKKAAEAIDPACLKGPILDLGCGPGYFMHHGLSEGFDVWGVDADLGKIARYREMLEVKKSPAEWAARCIQADAQDMPFERGKFSAVNSWYVLEHVKDLPAVLKETVRVTAPGGALVLIAQDARSPREGHCKIPWIPFLRGAAEAAWLQEFGADPRLHAGVYDITAPQVISVLEILGCEIVCRGPEPRPIVERHWELKSEQDIRACARSLKGRFTPEQLEAVEADILIHAVKNR